MKLGFIGLGVMGKSMAKNLLNAKLEVYIYTRTKEKAEMLIDNGAKWCETVAELSQKVDIVCTMVGYPKDVEEVYLGERGVFNNLKANGYAIDFTTSTPALAKRLYEEGKERDIHMLDAPVSGGDIGAREGRLAIMVGGKESTYRELLPIFEILGENIIYQGGAGSGQHTKMCNQIAIASNMLGVCESIAYGIKVGLDPEKVLQSISTGAAGSWSLSNLAPRMLKGDFEPGFYVKHFLKDMSIAIEEAERIQLDLPGLSLAKDLYTSLQNNGLGEKGTQALLKMYL